MLSDRFEALAGLKADEDVTLRGLEALLGEDGAPLVIVFLCLPFLFPMPIPGISTIFGLGIAVFTLRIAWPGKLLLPGPLERFTLKGESVKRIGRGGVGFVRKIEKLLRPRLPAFFSAPGRYLAAVAMLSSAVALALPIPPVIPFTNTIPALAITMFSLSFLTRDGLAALAGHALHFVSWIYFFTVAGVAFAFAREIVERVPILKTAWERILSFF